MSVSLNTIGIFESSPRDHLDLLAPFFETYQCLPGTVILQQGKPADYLYFVVSGSAEVSYKPYDGSPITISHVESGELFGWSAVVGSEHYTSSIIAIEPLKAVRIRGRDVRKICARHPKAGRDLLERLANSISWRLPNASQEIIAMLANGLKK